MKKQFRKLSYVLFIALFVVIWHFLSLGRKTLIFPSPYEVLLSLVSIVRSGIFIAVVFNTLKTIFLSFVIAFVPALVLGIFSKLVPVVYIVMDGVSAVARSIPTVAIILMALLLLPVSLTPLVICFFVVFPVLYINIAEGLVSVDGRLLEMARSYRINKRKIITDIYIPSLRPFLIAGIRSAIGLSFKIIVTAEVFNFVNSNTIGAQMYMHKIQIDLAGIIAWTIVVVVISLLVDFILKKLFERSEIQW
ncbi:MAG: ABC transporter permease subunit [Clostridiaceae bacterium]|jgi:NitT/TauT family transport system permease protein|nr:ABC transporter permease subunit [Clostridiaceae bacterium]